MRALALILELCPLLAAVQGEYFDLVVPTCTCCCARVERVAARSEAECALRCSRSSWSKSFSFMNGVCDPSDSSNCAFTETPKAFKKQIKSSSLALGYETQVGNRCFWVFQQRLTGEILFNRTWDEYVLGFGDTTDFWAGLTLIHEFAKSNSNRTIRLEMTTVDNEFYYQESTNFTVGDASTNYTMLVAGSNVYNTSDDVLIFHSGQQFSTIDRDNDMFSSGSCAMDRGGGGFWWGNCQQINPNGFYSSTLVTVDNYKYVATNFVQSYKTLRAIKMMIQL